MKVEYGLKWCWNTAAVMCDNNHFIREIKIPEMFTEHYSAAQIIDILKWVYFSAILQKRLQIGQAKKTEQLR